MYTRTGTTASCNTPHQRQLWTGTAAAEHVHRITHSACAGSVDGGAVRGLCVTVRAYTSSPASSKTGDTTVTSGRCVPPLYGSFSTYTSPAACQVRLIRLVSWEGGPLRRDNPMLSHTAWLGIRCPAAIRSPWYRRCAGSPCGWILPWSPGAPAGHRTSPDGSQLRESTRVDWVVCLWGGGYWMQCLC